MNADDVARACRLWQRLCPYVQRAAIVLSAKGVAFERVDMDLARKLDWLLEVSPWARRRCFSSTASQSFDWR